MKKNKMWKRNFVKEAVKNMKNHFNIYLLDVSKFRRKEDISDPEAMPWALNGILYGIRIHHHVLDEFEGQIFDTYTDEFIKLQYPVKFQVM